MSSYNSDNSSQNINRNALKKATKLKKYLIKNDCFDKDLVIILSSKYSVYDENDLTKINSNKKYDDIYNAIRVLRAADLKDNASRLRMEKNMIKFEKLWRKISKIKKKSSVTNNTNKNNKKDPISSRNDALTGKGSVLKNWMKKNNIWQQALYDELISNNINTNNDISSLSENEFDKIVRKVRVDRFSQLKNQSARNRADKLLVNFEKLWRKASGLKKTSIKKSKKKNKNKKDKSAGNTAANATTATTATTATAAAKPSDKKDPIMPWYLSGKQKNKKNSALAASPRTPHKKKKDNKVIKLVRESDEIEKQWLKIYSMAVYGDYIEKPVANSLSVNGPTTTAAANTDNDDNKDNDAATAAAPKVPDLWSISVDYEEIVVDVCIEMLLTLNESWEGRVSILNKLLEQLCDDNISIDMYALKFCKFLRSIGHQFTDPRSLIIQAMEEIISKLADTTPTKFIYFAPYILESLFVTFPVRIEACRDPGIKLGKFLINKLNEYDTAHTVLRKVFDGMNSKHAAVRSECADYLDLMLRKIPILEKDNQTDEEIQLLNEINDAVTKACKDASAEARMNGYRALTVYQNIAPNGAQLILDKMTNAQKKKYEEANKNQHY